MFTNSSLHKLFCHDFVYKDGKLYFAAYNLNGIFCFDIKQETSRLLAYIPDEISQGGNGYYNAIELLDGRLYIAPDHCNTFVVYDTASGQLSQIWMPETKYFYPEYSKFHSIAAWKKKVYFIPCRFPGIVEMDTQKNRMKIYENDVLGNQDILITDQIRIGTKLYMLTWNSKQKEADGVLVFNLLTRRYEELQAASDMKIYAFCNAQESIWMISDAGLAEYKLSTAEQNLYEFPAALSERIQALRIVFYDFKIWMFAENGEFFCTFHIENKTYSDLNDIPDRQCHKYLVNNYVTAKVYDEKLFYFNASAGTLYIFDHEVQKKYELGIPQEYDQSPLIRQSIKDTEVFLEGRDLSVFGCYYDLQDFLQSLDLGLNEKNADKNAGQTIYNLIRSQITI
ncbi:MAG: hypothetical protein HFH30_14115 [Eubacterium sp.]|nr:hypothetical protein [Eubacterium sp.]MCI8918709.1 hypothetical protein [Eubacterium sp.]